MSKIAQDQSIPNTAKDALVNELESCDESDEQTSSIIEQLFEKESKGVEDEFREEDHPRESKGEGGGQFKATGKTVEKQDDLGVPSKKEFTPEEKKLIAQKLNATPMPFQGKTQSIGHWVALAKHYETEYHDVCQRIKKGELPFSAKKKAFIRYNQMKSTIKNFAKKALQDILSKPLISGYDLPKSRYA